MQDDHLNAFRLPVTWQYLTNDNYDNGLDAARFELYDELVQGCLKSHAKLCIIDLRKSSIIYSSLAGTTPG